ncbi:peroxiredoxin family protein [Montanilutibacter psychrotolerans]|uniref:TlpA family protein disulfide reductase n=1 Tax=Montanilutibacter psychrotolerans TaxID=1327343 RepID=A0A3M8SSQ3_9GAMM|nr:TlpA disulfide reductase family protein [Lysobacter psychrotolerans]RNF83725.1 TlpA family protein disulfide reductase [Lysobacter psychrotolerans]
MQRNWIAYVLLLAACALVVLLSVQNRQLREGYDALVDAGRRPQVGSWLPATHTTTLDGQPVTLGAARGRHQVLYFFDPACPICEASLPAVRALALALRDAPQGQVELLGIAQPPRQAVDDYVRSRGLDFPVVLSAPKTLSLYDITVVPLLVVVDRDGRVLFSHNGQLNTKEEVAKVLTVVRAMDRPIAVTTTRRMQ